MIHVENLTVAFDEFVAVNNISFNIFKGEIFGLLGANGAGKTTTIRVLSGLLSPTNGSVTVDNIKFDRPENIEGIKQYIGYMSQKFTLYGDLTVDENWKFTASVRKLSKSFFETRKKYLREWLDVEYSNKILVRDLPTGVKQQVALANALFHDPKIIFLDEPTAGVSPYAREQFWNLIRQLANDGKTVIVTTHYMDEAAWCGRLALMRAGEIIALDTVDNLKRQTFKNGICCVPQDEISAEHKKILEQAALNNTIKIFPHGRMLHITVYQKDQWELAIRQTPMPLVSITPTLEDVFLELVEGVNR